MKAHVLAVAMLCLTTGAWAHYPYPGKIIVPPNMVMDNMTPSGTHCTAITGYTQIYACSNDDSGLNWIDDGDCTGGGMAHCLSYELDINVFAPLDQPDHYQDK